jgi:pimeloyl-CoA synthetase
MTREDKDEMREILHDYIAGVLAKSDAKFDIIDVKLDSIKEQTINIAGRVTKLESHPLDCELSTKVRVLEDKTLAFTSIRNWIVGTIVLTSVIFSIAVGIIEIIK